ncbi:hypothetical protein [Nonomuraea guangzhouensis]|uniref:Glycerophosphoryl diester phosphodiesterase membrane domain-containing protein n=1 Tax=Nonomuraea guangzhouensis TaxID=1291555 RepID=A0ABW4GSZ7_9ACTN|nr:hypothetical protein [Nonomuraea guangzhouensis]
MKLPTRARFVGLLMLVYCALLVLLAVLVIVSPAASTFASLLSIIAFPASLVTFLLPDLHFEDLVTVALLTGLGLVQAVPLWWFSRGKPRAAGGNAWARDETITEFTGRYSRGILAFWVSTGYGVFCLGAIAVGVFDMAGDMTGVVSPVLIYALLPLSVPALLVGNLFLYIYAFVIAAIVQTRLVWVLLRGRGVAVDLPTHLRPENLRK